MTQAFNLSQLANNLNSSGRLDATDGLVNAVPIANGGTGASTAEAARTNLGVAASVYSVPTGGIIMWSGSQASIPTGWVLCNGANGTPDLRDRFVLGAGNTYAVGATGGSKDAIVVSHTHTLSSDGTHQHYSTKSGIITSSIGLTASTPIAAGTIISGETYERYILKGNTGTADVGLTSSAGDHTHTVSTIGSSGTNANMPPYYALCFIMKT